MELAIDKVALGPGYSIFNGDALELFANLPDNSVDMVLADLPYGCTRNNWDSALPMQKVWENLDRVCKPEAAILLFSATKFTFHLVNSNFKDFRYRYIWVKNCPTGFLNAYVAPLRVFEEICVFYKKRGVFNVVKSYGHSTYKATQRSLSPNYGKSELVTTINNDGSRFPTDVLYYNCVNNSCKLHPTEKPVELLEKLIQTYTNDGDVVLDFTMGSGSTGVAALKNHRAFIGFEIEKKYFEAARSRLGAEF